MARFEFRQASFRGVDFEVLAEEQQGGREGPVHEYVGQDDGYFEDTGRKIRRWRLQGYIRGEGYLERSENLVTALELEGSGNLILPSGDVVAAVCTDFVRQLQPKNEAGQTRFQLSFVEANDYRFPTAITSLIGEISEQFNNLVGRVREIVGLPQAIIASVDDAFSVGFLASGETYSPGSGVGAELDRVANERLVGPEIALSVDEALIQTPVDTETTDVFRAATLTTGAALFADYSFTDRASASRLRDEFSARFDDVISRADQETQVELLAVRRAFLSQAGRQVLTLPEFAVVDLGGSCPAVVAAHRIFGDHARADDLIRWNPSVIHPLFMPDQVEVLRDA